MFECIFPKKDTIDNLTNKLSLLETRFQNQIDMDTKVFKELHERILILDDNCQKLEDQCTLLNVESQKLQDEYKLLHEKLPPQWIASISTLASAAGAAAMGTFVVQHPGSQIPISMISKLFTS